MAQDEPPTIAEVVRGLRLQVLADDRDWSRDRTDALLWAVLCGGTADEATWSSMAALHGWDETYVEALRARSAAVEAVVAGTVELDLTDRPTRRTAFRR